MMNEYNTTLIYFSSPEKGLETSKQCNGGDKVGGPPFSGWLDLYLVHHPAYVKKGGGGCIIDWKEVKKNVTDIYL